MIQRLHAKDPADRYQSAAEVAEELGRQLAELPAPGLAPDEPGATARQHGYPSPDDPAGGEADRSPLRLGGPQGQASARVPKRIAVAVLGILGLAAAAIVVRFAPASGDAGPPSVTFASSAQNGPGRPSSNVIVTAQDHGERPTIVGSGKPATKAFDLADFSSLEIAHGFRAEVTKADRFSVSVTADDNVLPHIRVVKEGTRLRIGLENNLSYRLRRNSLKVAIAMPALDAIDLSHGTRASSVGSSLTGH